MMSTAAVELDDDESEDAADELMLGLAIVLVESAAVRSGETFAWPQTKLAPNNKVHAVIEIEVVLWFMVPLSVP
jgi:hypothetical protein